MLHNFIRFMCMFIDSEEKEGDTSSDKRQSRENEKFIVF